MAPEKKEYKRPMMGKRIISEKQLRLMANKTVEEESFLNDPSIIDDSMDSSRRPPTMAEMMAAQQRQVDERKAEMKGAERKITRDLPPIPFKMPPRMDVSSSSEFSESDAESDKENEAVDEPSMRVVEREEEKKQKEEEEEKDETTPVAQQRSTGVAGASSTSAAAAVPPATPPARPNANNSGFRRPELPGAHQRPLKGPPRHSTPKVNARPRDSFGAAFGAANISVIAPNVSLHAPPVTTATGDSSGHSLEKTRGAGGGGRKDSARGAPMLDPASIDEEVEEAEGGQKEAAAPANNGTFIIEEAAAAQNGTFVVEGEAEQEEEEQEEREASLRVHVEAVDMRRVSVGGGDVSMMSVDDDGEAATERVEVVGVSIRRQSALAAAPRHSRRISSVEEEAEDEEEEEGGEEEMEGGQRGQRGAEESAVMEEEEDVEMASVNTTPVRRLSTRPAKRPSLEHALTIDSSPMAVAMARRSAGMRETMVRPKVSIASSTASRATTTAGGGAGGRKVSTGSVASSIPFEDLSNSRLSVTTSSERSYEEAATPVRTPRTTRLLRQSLAARDQRQSQQQQQQRLPILEEAEAQGGQRDEEDVDDEEEDYEEDEMMAPPRGGNGAAAAAASRSSTATTPVQQQQRLPRLSLKLQSSVDRLSQPRHRQEPARPCARSLAAASPSRAAPVQRAARPPPMAPSPSPGRNRLHSFNQGRGGGGMMASGYTPNQRIDTTLMEDEEGGAAKSGMAARIRRVPRRVQQQQPGGGGVGKGAAVASAVGGGGGAVLNLLGGGEEQSHSDIEQERRARRGGEKAAVVRRLSPSSVMQSKDSSVLSHTSAQQHTPVTSPLVAHHDHQHSFDDDDGNLEEPTLDGEEHRNLEDDEEEGHQEEDEEAEDASQRHDHSMAASMGGGAASGAEEDDDDGVFARPALPPLAATPLRAANIRGRPSLGRRSMLEDSDGTTTEDMERLSRRASQISIVDGTAPRGSRATSVAASSSAASMNGSFNNDLPATPKTPFRRAVARNQDLFSTDTPGIGARPSFVDTEEEEEWAANQDSRIWRGDASTAEDENEASPPEDSQMDFNVEDDEEEDVTSRILAPRKIIAPTASPGVRRSTRNRMKPVRTWLGEQAQYAPSPTTGERRLVGVNEVVIRDKIFVQTGTADIQKAVEAKKKTAKQRSIANKKRKDQKRAQEEESE